MLSLTYNGLALLHGRLGAMRKRQVSEVEVGIMCVDKFRKMHYSLHCMEESLEVKGAAIEASPNFTTWT